MLINAKEFYADEWLGLIILKGGPTHNHTHSFQKISGFYNKNNLFLKKLVYKRFKSNICMLFKLFA